MTWLPAGQVYGYRISEGTDVLVWFHGPPGGTTWANERTNAESVGGTNP